MVGVFATFIGLGGVLVHNGRKIEDLIAEPNAYLKTQLSDWEKNPYTDIEVLPSSQACSDGYDEAYRGYWPGTTQGCDCLGICGRYMDGCYKFHVGVSCTHNQTMYGCDYARPHPEVFMPQMNQKRVCGRTDRASAFLGAIRPNDLNECPDGYKKCSEATNAESTICIENEKDSSAYCPITDIQFVEKATSFNYATTDW